MGMGQILPVSLVSPLGTATAELSGGDADRERERERETGTWIIKQSDIITPMGSNVPHLSECAGGAGAVGLAKAQPRAGDRTLGGKTAASCVCFSQALAFRQCGNWGWHAAGSADPLVRVWACLAELRPLDPHFWCFCILEWYRCCQRICGLFSWLRMPSWPLRRRSTGKTLGTLQAPSTSCSGGCLGWLIGAPRWDLGP